MKSLKAIFLFSVTYFFLQWPFIGFDKRYIHWFQDSAKFLWSKWGNDGIVAIESTDKAPFDTRIILGNRTVFLSEGKLRGGEFFYSIRYHCFFATCVLTALFMATPFTWRKKIMKLIIAQGILQAIGFVSLGLSVWNKYIQTPELGLFQFNPEIKSLISQIDRFCNQGFVFFLAVVTLLWILLLIIGQQKTMAD